MAHWNEVASEDVLVGLTHADVEITDLDEVRSVLARIRPDVVVNTSAYHKVDMVEDDPDRAFQVNGSGARNLALACEEAGAVAVHFSTDYVFSGRNRSRDQPYKESEPVEPLNVYGVSKAAGEMLVRYLCERHFIVRVSGLYGVAGSSGKGGNFVETMLRLAVAGNPIRVVDDQVLTPTHTAAIARQLPLLIQTQAYGTFHATCQGECSWFEFAAEIFKLAGADVDLSPQTTAQAGTRALRPSYSVLDNRSLRELGIDRMPDWRTALADYISLRTAPV